SHPHSADMPLKAHERVFRERVPLDAKRHGEVRPSDSWDYGPLAEMVEAWGFRMMQERVEYVDGVELAQLWYEEDFVPVVETLRAGRFIRTGESDADAYMR